MADNSLGAKVGVPVVLPTDIFIGNFTTTANLAISNVGTITGVSVDYDQKGRFLVANGQFTLGTTVATALVLTLPFSQVSAYGTARQIGTWYKSINTASTRKRGTIWVSAGGVVAFGSDDYTTAEYPDNGITGTALGSSGQIIYFEYKIPTVGYSLTQTTAYGAGLATSAKAGLVSREQSSIGAYSLAGATTTPTINIRQVRNGDQVTLTLSPSAKVIKTASPGALSITAIPSDFRPTANLTFIQYGLVNNVGTAVAWRITTAGVIEMYGSADLANIGASVTNVGWDYDVSFAYTIR